MTIDEVKEAVSSILNECISMQMYLILSKRSIIPRL